MVSNHSRTRSPSNIGRHVPPSRRNGNKGAARANDISTCTVACPSTSSWPTTTTPSVNPNVAIGAIRSAGNGAAAGEYAEARETTVRVGGQSAVGQRRGASRRTRSIRCRHVLDVGQVGWRPCRRGIGGEIPNVQPEALRREERDVHLQHTVRHRGIEPVLLDQVAPLKGVHRRRHPADRARDQRGGCRGCSAGPRATDEQTAHEHAGDRGSDRRYQAVPPARGWTAREGARSARPFPRHAGHDRLGQVGHTLGGPDPHRRAHARGSLLERAARGAARNVGIHAGPLRRGEVLAVHPSREQRLHVSAVHGAASSSPAIARHSAWRARNMRLFTVPTATPSTSATSW